MWVPRAEFIRQADQFEQFLNSRAHAFFRPPFNPGNNRDVLLDSEMWEEADLLNYVSDAPAELDDIRLGIWFGIYEHFTLGRGCQTINQLEGGRFAGAASAKQHESFPACDLQIEIRDDLRARDRVRDLAKFNDRTCSFGGHLRQAYRKS